MKENRPLIIAGSHRSGTTWLHNIISAPLSYRLIFEPLHPEISGHRDWVRLFLEEDAAQPELKAYLASVFGGQVHNRWMMQGGHRRLLFFYRNRWWSNNLVVKCIRANLMLEWLAKTFDARILYIIRHPCAVVASVRNMGWEEAVKWSLESLRGEAGLVDCYLAPYRRVLFDDNLSSVQELALLWCIENKVPLLQFEKNKWTGMLYESLLMQPEKELDRVYEQLKLRRPFPGYRMVKKVAHTTRDRKKRQEQNPLAKWQSDLSEMEKKEVLDIVEAFDIGIYGNEMLPVADSFEDALKAVDRGRVQ